MDEITLRWEGPFTGSELRERIIGVHPDQLLKDPKYSCLYWPGVYVFYDKKRIARDFLFHLVERTRPLGG